MIVVVVAADDDVMNCKSIFCILCFSDLHERIPPMRMNKLRLLQNVEEITDYLLIDTNYTRLRNLNFLSNLRAVHGRHTVYAPLRLIITGIIVYSDFVYSLPTVSYDVYKRLSVGVL